MALARLDAADGCSFCPHLTPEEVELLEERFVRDQTLQELGLRYAYATTIRSRIADPPGCVRCPTCSSRCRLARSDRSRLSPIDHAAPRPPPRPGRQAAQSVPCRVA